MNRRALILAGLAAGFLGTAAIAQDFETIIVEQLKAAGFTEIRLTRTWLGRVRIVATNDSFRRELILNPRTNEVLRDLWVNVGTGVAGTGLFDPDDAEDNYRRSGGVEDNEGSDDRGDDDRDDDGGDDDGGSDDNGGDDGGDSDGGDDGGDSDGGDDGGDSDGGDDGGDSDGGDDGGGDDGGDDGDDD